VSEHPEQIPEDSTETVDERDLLPEVLSVSTWSLMFCAETFIWPKFRRWLDARNYPPDGPVSPQFLVDASLIMKELITQVEAELLSQKLTEFLGEMDEQL
jgi:hypothetical protein